jgi:hypothetical protein
MRDEGARARAAKASLERLHTVLARKGQGQTLRDNSITIRSINEMIGFWKTIRALRSKVALLKGELVEYGWACGCNALASNGAVTQLVKCKEHGGVDDFEFDSFDEEQL